MKNVRASWVVLCGVLLAACGETTGPLAEQSQVSASEELVSETQVNEAVDFSDRAEFKTDVANTDRVCDISGRTVAASGVLLEKADQLNAYLQEKFPNSESAERSPAFAQASENLYATLQAPASCRTIVLDFIAMARAGRALGGALFREHLPQRDDRLGVIVRETRIAFGRLHQLLREDLGTQVTDRRVSDRATSDRP